MFALRLEEAGAIGRSSSRPLAVDRAEASKLISVARDVPRDIADAIGKAAKIGRGRAGSNLPRR